MASLPPSIPPTHQGVSIAAPRHPLQLIHRPTIAPGPDEVLVHVTWTSSSPLDLHRADGGLLLDPLPYPMGSTVGGTVVALGPSSSDSDSDSPRVLRVGDTVYGFTKDGDAKQSGAQEYATVPAWRVSKLPAGGKLTLPEAVAVPTNLVTALHVLTEDLGLELPWPWSGPKDRALPQADEPILVWGAASSVGMYVVQVLRHWGYGRVLAVASGKHHGELRRLGASECFDYRKEAVVVEEILGYVERAKGRKEERTGPGLKFIVDCIGSKEGTLRPLSKIAEPGAKVGIMLPVINVHAGEEQVPEYEMDVSKVFPEEWAEGVELKGTRTHFYAKNEFFKKHLQPEIVPALLEQGAIEPNKLRIVEGKTLLERAENALTFLRSQAPSGEKLVWRVADKDD